MFYHLNGTVAELTAESLVLDCNGIGFEITITPNTASALKIGEQAKVYITEAIGENNFDLYGFLTGREKQFFKMLTSVSGIGPKAAMSILSYNTPDALALAIVNGREAALTACPGIGKKTAQRVILELKDKISKTVSGTEKQCPALERRSCRQVEEPLMMMRLRRCLCSDTAPLTLFRFCVRSIRRE